MVLAVDTYRHLEEKTNIVLWTGINYYQGKTMRHRALEGVNTKICLHPSGGT